MHPNFEKSKKDLSSPPFQTENSFQASTIIENLNHCITANNFPSQVTANSEGVQMLRSERKENISVVVDPFLRVESPQSKMVEEKKEERLLDPENFNEESLLHNQSEMENELKGETIFISIHTQDKKHAKRDTKDKINKQVHLPDPAIDFSSILNDSKLNLNKSQQQGNLLFQLNDSEDLTDSQNEINQDFALKNASEPIKKIKKAKSYEGITEELRGPDKITSFPRRIENLPISDFSSLEKDWKSFNKKDDNAESQEAKVKRSKDFSFRSIEECNRPVLPSAREQERDDELKFSNTNMSDTFDEPLHLILNAYETSLTEKEECLNLLRGLRLKEFENVMSRITSTMSSISCTRRTQVSLFETIKNFFKGILHKRK